MRVKVQLFRRDQKGVGCGLAVGDLRTGDNIVEIPRRAGGLQIHLDHIPLPSFAVIYLISLFFDRFLQLTVVANAFKGIQACVIYLILSAGVKMLKNLQRTPFNTAVVAVVLAAMVGCSVLAVKFSSICCILFCGAAGVLAYAVGQGKKGGTK